MKIGVIGVGNMGKNHARIYSEMRGVDDVYLFDLNRKTLEDVSKSVGGYQCKSIDQLLEEVDAVSICVPTKYHYDTIQEVIAYNTPFLVEKPVCSTAKEAEHIIEILPNHIVCGVGHIERFNPIVSEIKRLIKRPLYVDIRRHNPSSQRITDSTVIEDLMIHDIDILFNVIFSEYPKYSLECFGDEHICTASFKFGQVPAHVSTSRRSSKKVRSIYVEDENYTIEGDFMNQEMYVYRTPKQYQMKNYAYIQENVVDKVVVNKLEPLRVELSRFLGCIENHRAFPVTIEQAAFNLSVCEFIKAKLK